jgi:adenosylcobinamide-GDP ribazoletransferase
VARPLSGDREAGIGAITPVAELRAALALLTRIPVGASAVDRSGAGAFGVVGALTGGLSAVPVLLLGGSLPVVAAMLSLIGLALVSGVLHLDGLADTADALVATGPVAAERARKDPAAGPAGVIAIVATLAIEVACLGAVLAVGGAPVAAALLVAGATVSRSGAVLLGWAHRTAVAGVGSGARFRRDITGAGVVVTLASSASVVAVAWLLTGSSAVLAAGAGGLLGGLAVGSAIGRLRRQLDGDGFGATVELGMAAALLSGAIVVSLGGGF